MINAPARLDSGHQARNLRYTFISTCKHKNSTLHVENFTGFSHGRCHSGVHTNLQHASCHSTYKCCTNPIRTFWCAWRLKPWGSFGVHEPLHTRQIHLSNFVFVWSKVFKFITLEEDGTEWRCRCVRVVRVCIHHSTWNFELMNFS